MTISTQWFQPSDIPQLFESTVGIEKESLRLDNQGNFSQHTHDSGGLGGRDYHPYIQTDFAEAQLELITPPLKQNQDLINWLAGLHQITAAAYPEDLIWPASPPAKLNSDRDTIPVAKLSNSKEVAYREHLVQVYGKDVQLVSGIHYNFQIKPQLVHKLVGSRFPSFIQATNQIYFELGRRYFRYRWLLTYLFGVSPYVDSTYESKLFGTPPQTIMRSIRQSRYGYRNANSINIDYSSLTSMIESIEKAVNDNFLSLEKELYRDVRFRGGQKVRDFLCQGIKYLEFRNFDLNPFTPYGITKDQIDFIKLFLISLLFLEGETDDASVNLGNRLNQAVAEAHPKTPCPDLEEGKLLCQSMREVAQVLKENSQIDLLPLVEKAEAALEDSKLTLAGQLINECPDPANFLAWGLEQAREFKQGYQKRPYHLHGFENFELSTQDVIKEALKVGLKLEIVDPMDNLIKVSHQGHQEYIRNGNMTAKDSLISYFLMENKVATKEILKEAGIYVPQGQHFNEIDEASHYYPFLPEQGFVVKPKNTNYGLGISIFKTLPSQSQYRQALEIAFEEDNTILVESFVPGDELRFYVQAGEVLAVCERQPAQVVGDGKHTISQLIDQANQHPLRGPKHFAPMTLLEKGKTEALQLEANQLNFESIPDKNQVVYLRENSNVSTGGLSIDRTDQVYDDYNAIAIQAAEALGTTFCGVDILIKDYTAPIKQTGDYGVIEANFNPAMSIHRFVGQGQDRYLGRAVLQELFPELTWPQ